MLEDVKTYFANFDGRMNTCRTIALWIAIALVIAFVVTRVYVAVVTKKRKQMQSSSNLGDTSNAIDESISHDESVLDNGVNDVDNSDLAKNKNAKASVNASKSLNASENDDAITRRALSLLNGAWIAIAIVVSIAFIIAFFVCYLVDVSKGEDVLVPILFYPLMTLAITIVGGGTAIFFKPNKIVRIVSGAVAAAALIAVVVCMGVYYASGESGEAFSNLGLYLSSVALIAAVIAFAFVTDKDKSGFDTRSITFAAVCVALSFALSYVRLFKLPMGGSITLASMLPLMLFSFMFGCRKGIIVGLAYGVLQAIQDPWIIHPAQFALDYLIAFASIGLCGCFKAKGLHKKNVRLQFVLGATVACGFRFLSHYLAGVFAFGAYGEFYAVEYNMAVLANPYMYSFVYQCMYVIPELIIVLIVGTIVLSSSSFRRQIEKYSAKREVKAKA